MFSFVNPIAKLSAAISVVLLLLLSSCATYYQRIQAYHTSLATGNFLKADEQLDGIGLLQKSRNKLLYLLEKGKTAHLLQQYDSSNTYFNEADQIIESSRTTAKDLLVTGLLNPMFQDYHPEDFEKFMVHYYKALNYLFLGNTEDALVEARRITLASNQQEDKWSGKKNRYNDDAFSMMLQGMIYEKGNDMNNAFIAYRNAAEVYLKNDSKYYGTSMPLQLKKDVLRTAYLMGFSSEQSRYEKIFDRVYTNEPNATGGEAIVFWESGMAPVKEQQTIQFNIVANSGQFFFRDNAGLYNVPFDNSVVGYNQNLRLSDIQMFAIALPKYREQPMRFWGATLSSPAGTFSFEKAQDISTLAVQTLKQRFGKELATALSRMAIKKLTEIAATPKEDKKKKYRNEEERKKAERKRDQQELLALGLKIFNRATEKADTRNWQSLPNSIFYSRIPLQPGVNNISISLRNSGTVSDNRTIVLEGNGGLQFATVYTMR